MISRRKREYLKIQLLETQRMLELIGNHPIMSQSLKLKVNDLMEQLKKIPEDQKDSKIDFLP